LHFTSKIQDFAIGLNNLALLYYYQDRYAEAWIRQVTAWCHTTSKVELQPSHRGNFVHVHWAVAVSSDYQPRHC